VLDVDWSNICPFLHPPIPLINKVLEKFKVECKEGIIIVPDWPGQKWSVILKELALKRYILGQSSKVLIKGAKMEKKYSISEKPLCLPPGKLVMYKIRNPCLSPLSQITIRGDMPEINMGKIIWQIGGKHKEVIKRKP
jgi:hypothetical protein